MLDRLQDANFQVSYGCTAKDIYNIPLQIPKYIYIKSVNEQDTLSQEVKYFLTLIQCPFHRLC